MPVRILKAEELVLERGENGRGDDHHGHGHARDYASLLSDLWIIRQHVHRRSRQDETDDDRTDGSAAMVAEGPGAEERGCPALPSLLDDSHMSIQADHPESAAHQDQRRQDHDIRRDAAMQQQTTTPCSAR